MKAYRGPEVRMSLSEINGSLSADCVAADDKPAYVSLQHGFSDCSGIISEGFKI
jgi:hypothetical protein